MKLAISLSILLSFGALTAPQWAKSSPVEEQSIPANVDWFVHLDGDSLRSSRAGSTFINEIRQAIPTNQEGAQQLPIDPTLLLDGISGLTVFGAMPVTNSEGQPEIDAVVLMEGTTDMIQVFRGLIAGFQLEKPEAIVTTDFGKLRVLSMPEEGVHGVFIDDNHLAIGKSLPALQQFLAVREGKGGHISLGQRFPTYRLGRESGIFFGAFVEGLDSFDDLPVQARILKMTQAVSVQLGELGENVNLLASLVTDSPQTGQQVGEVLKGLLALLVITQNGQPDVASLVQSARVDQDGSAVTLRLAYPVAQVEKWAVLLGDQIRASMQQAQQGGSPDTGADSDSGNEPATGE